MEQVLESCCGFLHDLEPASQQKMIERYLNTLNPGREGGVYGMKRRAFLVTSVPLEGSVELVPGWFVQTMNPWTPEAVGSSLPTNAHHVKPYNIFYDKEILGKTVFNIAGFDGDMDMRQEKFDDLLKMHPTLPRLCILSNGQHELGEPFLIKNGFKLVIRGINQYWHDNHLSIFVKEAPVAKAQAAA